MVSFGLGLAMGILIAPLVLASEVDQTQKDEWCFVTEYQSIEELRAKDTHSYILIKFNGRKAQSWIKC